MKIEITEKSSTEKEIDVIIPQEDVTALLDGKVEKYRKQLKMPGFRAGKKLPKKLVMARFGEAIRQEALEEAIDGGLRTELEKAGIKPVSYGEMADFKDEKDKDITFKIIVEVEPEIEITGYADLGVTVEDTEVDDSELEKMLSDMQRHTAKQEEVDRASKKGDVVTGDYLHIELDGENQEIPENPEFSAEIGASKTAGFDDGLQGVKAGDEKEISFTYPDDHANADLAGKKASFSVKVKAVKELKLPEIDEEFAKSMGAESVENLREQMAENLKKQKLDEKKGDAHDKAIDLLIEKNPFDVPESRIKQYVAHVVNRYLPEDQQQEPTAEQIEANRENAVRELRKIRILEYIAGKEKFKVRQKDVDERLQQMAAMYGMDFEMLKSSMRQSGRIVNLREELKIEKTLDYLVGIRDEDDEK